MAMPMFDSCWRDGQCRLLLNHSCAVHVATAFNAYASKLKKDDIRYLPYIEGYAKLRSLAAKSSSLRVDTARSEFPTPNLAKSLCRASDEQNAAPSVLCEVSLPLLGCTLRLMQRIIILVASLHFLQKTE